MLVKIQSNTKKPKYPFKLLNEAGIDIDFIKATSIQSAAKYFKKRFNSLRNCRVVINYCGSSEDFKTMYGCELNDLQIEYKFR